MNDLEVLQSKLDISGAVIERTQRRMKQNFQRLLKEANTEITVDQWLLLQELSKENGLSQLELAQRAYKDAPTVTRILDLLVKKQLIERVADETDRRKFSIELTKAGHKKIKEVTPVLREFRSKAWAGLSDNEVSKLTIVLNRIFTNLD